MPTVNTIMTLLVTIIIIVIGVMMFQITLESIDDIPVEGETEVLPNGYMKGEIESLSEYNNDGCNIIFKNDVTLYMMKDVSQGEYQLLSRAKFEEEEIMIHYDNQNNLLEVGGNLEIPEPEPEPFNWWIIVIPIGLLCFFYVVPKCVTTTHNWYTYRKEHQEEIERERRAKAEKRRKAEEKKIKQKETKLRQQYHTAERTSRTAKAAQILDQQEGKRRRKN